MTDQERKAMQMALDALDSCEFDYDWEERPYKTFDEDLVNDAVDALRKALDHVPDTMKMLEPDMGIDRGAWDDVPDATKWVDELRGGDETEQEPVAWLEAGGWGDFFVSNERKGSFPVFKYPPSKPWVSLSDRDITGAAHTEARYPVSILETTDSGLCMQFSETGEWHASDKRGDFMKVNGFLMSFARAIEAKLKEKNT